MANITIWETDNGVFFIAVTEQNNKIHFEIADKEEEIWIIAPTQKKDVKDLIEALTAHMAKEENNEQTLGR